MKKVLAIVAIAAFAACNNAPSEAVAIDSAKYKDSVAKAEQEKMKMTDTTHKMADTTTKMAADTSKMKK